MLINTTFAMALFCSSCGRMHVEKFSFFSRSNFIDKSIDCECGSYIGALRPKGKNTYRLFVACGTFEDEQTIRLSHKLLSCKKIYLLHDKERHTELGFFGSQDAVEQELVSRRNQAYNYLKEIIPEEKTNDPQIMFEIINKVDNLAIKGSVCCSQCGDYDIGIEVFDNSIKIYCHKCGNTHEIKAANEEDAQKARMLKFLEL